MLSPMSTSQQYVLSSSGNDTCTLFLAQLSWMLKWAFLIAVCHPSVSVCPSIRLFINLHFQILLQSSWAYFNQTWHKSSFGAFFLMKCFTDYHFIGNGNGPLVFEDQNFQYHHVQGHMRGKFCSPTCGVSISKRRKAWETRSRKIKVELTITKLIYSQNNYAHGL
jgi:hypothetical protein